MQIPNLMKPTATIHDAQIRRRHSIIYYSLFFISQGYEIREFVDSRKLCFGSDRKRSTNFNTMSALYYNEEEIIIIKQWCIYLLILHTVLFGFVSLIIIKYSIFLYIFPVAFVIFFNKNFNIKFHIIVHNSF